MRLSGIGWCLSFVAGLALGCGGIEESAGGGSSGGSTAVDTPSTVSGSAQTGDATSEQGSSSSSQGSVSGSESGSTSDGSDSSTSLADSSSAGTSSSSGSTTIGTEGESVEFVAVTFNTGGHAAGEDDVADEWYGNGLSWQPAVQQTTAFFAELQPDIVVFQEIFHSPDCADIPPEFHPGYVCQDWSEGDPTVAQVILGPGYQIACHLGKTDKCAAVKTSFGSFAGCDADYCIEGLDGGPVEDCGSGSRVGRGVIELASGGEITLVNFHGTSGFSLDDQACRVGQVDQVFVDLLDGSGEPGANGVQNLVLGDFNADPFRSVLIDISAQRWNDFIGDAHPFHFITDVGPDVLPTYAGVANIDHQASDAFEGECWHPGITPGYDPVVDFAYFDHVPAVCQLSASR